MDPVTTQAVAKATEATAKAAGQGLEIVHDTGGYLRHVFGEVPADLVGVLGGAWLHESHIRIKDALRRRTEEIIRERDVQHVIELSPNVAAALIAGAQEEGREELMELWALLLANAMDPNMNNVRQSFIEAVKRMDPLDAVVLRYVYEARIDIVSFDKQLELTSNRAMWCESIAREIARRFDEVEVSIRHLKDLSLFDEHHWIGDDHDGEKIEQLSWWVNAAGREFLRACYPELSKGELT